MFQDGGISQYLVDYMPFAFQQQTTTEKSSSSNNKQNEVGIKDLLGLIKELKGLPIDSAIITDRISDMYTNLSLYNNGQIDTSDLINTYLSVLRDIRTAEFNKQEYEDAKKETVSNESYNEAAFDQYGNMWIQDTESGEISRVTPEEYISMGDKESYQVLTNSNLLYLRANSPDFAFRNEILSVVHNGTSIKEITEQLQKVANHIGTTTLKEEGYSERTAQNIIQGMATIEKGFQEGMTVQGLYKQGKITKDQTQQAKAALTYLWNTLPANAKGLLTLKGESTEGALNLINTLISSSLSSEIDYTQDLIKDPREDSKKDGKDGKGEGKGIEVSPNIAFVLGMGYQRKITLNPGTSFQFDAIGNYGVLTNHTGEPYKEYDTLRDVSGGSFAGLLDFNNATYGGVKIDTLDKVFLKNSDVIGLDLPIDIKYFSETGIIRPDIMLTSKLEKLTEAINQGVIHKDNVEEVNSFCQSIDLPSMYVGYDENGNPKLNTAQWARFARIGALVDENALQDEDQVASYAQTEANDNTRENFVKHMKTVDKNYKLDDGWFGRDSLYEGAVFIPVREDIIGATLGGNKYYKLPADNAISAAQKWADNQKVQTYTPGKSLNEVKNG